MGFPRTFSNRQQVRIVKTAFTLEIFRMNLKVQRVTCRYGFVLLFLKWRVRVLDG